MKGTVPSIFIKQHSFKYIKITEKSSSMYHFLEAALNSMPQRSTSVRTLHKVKCHLAKANKLFENEKEKTTTNEHQDMNNFHYILRYHANLRF